MPDDRGTGRPPRRAGASAERVLGAIERMGPLSGLQRRLNAHSDTGELLAFAVAEIIRDGSFDRALVLELTGDRLSAEAIGTIAHERSDALRRQVLGSPIRLEPATQESELFRRPLPMGASPRARRSLLAERLDLGHWAVGVLAPDGLPAGLVLVDRADVPVEEAERLALGLFCQVLGAAVTRAVMRRRIEDLSAEVRHLALSTQAVMREAMEAPVGLGADAIPGMGFRAAPGEPGVGADVERLLTDRESGVAALMVQGLSNKEIADHLHLSPETVKANVGRILRKLGAANRVQAVTRLMRAGFDAR